MWFPKIQSGGIRAVSQNQSIIRCDVCDHPLAWDVCRRSVQVASRTGGASCFRPPLVASKRSSGVRSWGRESVTREGRLIAARGAMTLTAVCAPGPLPCATRRVFLSSATLRRSASMRLITRCGAPNLGLRSCTVPACLAFSARAAPPRSGRGRSSGRNRWPCCRQYA
jgi:hypothetical protein